MSVREGAHLDAFFASLGPARSFLWQQLARSRLQHRETLLMMGTDATSVMQYFPYANYIPKSAKKEVSDTEEAEQTSV